MLLVAFAGEELPPPPQAETPTAATNNSPLRLVCRLIVRLVFCPVSELPYSELAYSELPNTELPNTELPVTELPILELVVLSDKHFNLIRCKVARVYTFDFAFRVEQKIGRGTT